MLRGGAFEELEDIFELDDKDMLYDDYKRDLMAEWVEGRNCRFYISLFIPGSSLFKSNNNSI